MDLKKTGTRSSLIKAAIACCSSDKLQVVTLLLLAIGTLVLLYSTSTKNQIAKINIGTGVDVDARIQQIKQLDTGDVEIVLRISRNSSLRLNTTKPDVMTNKPNSTLVVPTESKRISKHINYPLTIDSPYVINNPNICDVDNVTFLIIVHTHPKHLERRTSLRETWANKHTFRDINVRIVFFFGLPTQKSAQLMIENESTVYGDTVQGMFLDTYKNLTHKGVLAFRWVSEYCNHAEFIIKVDDDVFINIFKVLEDYYPKYKNDSKFILCHLRPEGTSPIVRNNSKLKWTVDDDDFRGRKNYPIYCNGYAVFMSPKLMRGMYRSARFTPFFWVDDVYLFGLLPKKVDAKWESMLKNLTLNQNVGLNDYEGNATNTRFIGCAAWQPNAMQRYWYAALLRLKEPTRSLVNPDLIKTMDKMRVEFEKRQVERAKQIAIDEAKKREDDKKREEEKKKAAEAAKNETISAKKIIDSKPGETLKNVLDSVIKKVQKNETKR